MESAYAACCRYVSKAKKQTKNNEKTNQKQWGQKIRSLCRLLQGRFQKPKTNNTLDMVDFLLLLTSEILKRNIMTNVKSKLLYNGESFWWKQCNERQLLMKAEMQKKCCCSATAATAWSIICCLSVFLFIFYGCFKMVVQPNCSCLVNYWLFYNWEGRHWAITQLQI